VYPVKPTEEGGSGVTAERADGVALRHNVQRAHGIEIKNSDRLEKLVELGD
jgi:hypothetical protein